MKNMLLVISRTGVKLRLFSFLVFIFCIICQRAFAHQSPTTIVLIDLSPGKVAMELQLPLSELELAFGHEVAKNPEKLVERLGPQLAAYLKAHIRPFAAKGNPWLVEVTAMKVEEAQQVASGPPFQEITVHLTLTPPQGVSTRNFILDYDVIMHQVVTHEAFVSVRNDWELGKADTVLSKVGVIRVDIKTNEIYPFEINLEKGSWWKGFVSMVTLGMHHIKEGTDHLLFLIVLLLPATLLLNRNRWGKFGGTKYSVVRLLKIVTAFTIGHSFTLVIGALGLLRLPTQPVEVLIAISILISAVHAIKPIFPGKESYVAAGFGVVHGLAFASILADLNLNTGAMAISILGFNIGIEVMQLFVILLIVPWLILISNTPVYKIVRIGGAALAGIAAIAWAIQRASNQENQITIFIQKTVEHAPWLILALAVCSPLIF